MATGLDIRWGDRVLSPSVGARVLVAYASTGETTPTVAARLAAGLRERRHRVDVSRCDEVVGLELYDALVVGSEVLGREWLPQAEVFLRSNAGTLTGRPVWMFSVGSPSARHGGLLTRNEPRSLRDLEHLIGPRDMRLFTEALEQESLEVDSWAARIGEALRAGTSKAPPGFAPSPG